MSRREALAAGAAAALALQRAAAAGATAPSWSRTIRFADLPEGDGWPGWTCAGVANLRRADGRGVLEAASDVFPCDPRPVAFRVDQRFREGSITAVLAAAGAGAGLVLRRVGPRAYYAAILDDEQKSLVIVRRSPDAVTELARIPFASTGSPLELSFSASGRNPTTLVASARSGATVAVPITARDSAPELQRAGDAGVLATARTLFPNEGPPVLPALGNVHLLPYGVQEGEAFMDTQVGKEVLATIRERSTAAFEEIRIQGIGSPGPTPASVVAATTGAPRRRGATLRIAADLPARVEIELASNPSFRRSRRIPVGAANDAHAVHPNLSELAPARRVYWRARLRRSGRETVGPTRSFRVLPAPGSGARARVAIGACASQFGPIFDHLAASRPDVFVWQGDLNYPDTIGPLAQTVSAYEGIWRDFLANPRLSPIFEQALFAAQRDDHDYAVQDANSTNMVPWGIAPWEQLVEQRVYYRFPAGVAEFWVLDQRRFKTDPQAPDGPAKTLLGPAQREWLLRTLAASPATFKVICSPCTLALPANGRDGNWSSHFTSERDLLLTHIREHVKGTTIFVTGDTHWTMVYDHDGLFEARPCPLGIPTPNDITLTTPTAAADARKVPGVLYADQEQSHFALIDVSAKRGVARLDLALVREDGATPFQQWFESPRPPSPARQRIRPV